MSEYQKTVESIFNLADIHINGSHPWDITVHDQRFFQRLLAERSLGFGEAYMDGWWSCEQPDDMLARILSSHLYLKVKPNAQLIWHLIKARFSNLQTKRLARKVAEQHYDIDNDLYQLMLDKRLCYTCGYWDNASTLDQAQENKLDLICQKLALKPGMRVLDIGCGWGSFSKYAAEHYGVEVTGVTISKEQIALGNALCKGLPVKLHLKDYRDVEGQYDRVVALGVLEHIGHKNYGEFMNTVARSLNDDGLALLHTIGNLNTVYTTEPWLEKYIFPNSMIPSLKQLANAWEGKLVIEDMHNFGADYDKTLMAWQQNFSNNWHLLKDKYDERFFNMWNYYLFSCAASFRVRRNQLWQFVVSKTGVQNGYKRVGERSMVSLPNKNAASLAALTE